MMFWNRKTQPLSSIVRETTNHVPLLDAEDRIAREPKTTPGYYPGFHTLDQQNYWDAATRQLILDRVRNIPLSSFSFPKKPRRCKP